MKQATIRQIGATVQLIIEGTPHKMPSMLAAFQYAIARGIEIINVDSLSEYFQGEYIRIKAVNNQNR